MDALVKACDVAAGDLSDIPWSPPTSSSSSITPRSWSLHFNSVPKSLVFTVPQSSSSPHTTAVNFTTSSDDSNNLDLVAKGLEVINRNSSATSISSDSSTAATLIPADLIIKSIGYSAEHYPGLSLLLNQQGAKSSSSSASLSPPTSPLTHIQNTNGRVAPGVYVAGWLKRGPVGVIASTMHDAYATATTLLSDLQLDSSQSQSSQSSSESLTPTFEEKPGFALIEPILRERGINWCSYDEWLRIDTEEVHRGGLLGKPREKITSVKEMITIAKQKNM